MLYYTITNYYFTGVQGTIPKLPYKHKIKAVKTENIYNIVRDKVAIKLYQTHHNQETTVSYSTLHFVQSGTAPLEHDTTQINIFSR